MMALPRERVMPVTTARWSELDRAYLVALPGGIELPARDETAVVELAAHHAPGSSIRFVNLSSHRRGGQK